MNELKEENEFLRNENMRLTKSLNELNDTLKKLIEEEKMIASTNVENTEKQDQQDEKLGSCWQPVHTIKDS
ncbi:hypothetical protein C923_01823 [Plasmodium falciparum UGT5.1]|uniref:Uncharacterized protein n=1 Tax=Plasmodium falciparum UGT5.1 TaxID=1237627 RepID=W7JRI4_PLAFA|nr:hypothetical protein C923_01823 [Plasmodium falciparum UGT5.1]